MPIAALIALAAATPCALAAPAGCRNTAELLRSPGVSEGITAVAGGRRANYLSATHAPVAQQALAVLGGPPDPPRRVADGWLFTGCRAQSCGEKGAVAIDAGGQVAAIAILHSGCGLQRAKPGCADERSLAVHGGPLSAPMRAAILGWAKAANGGVAPAVYENGAGEPVAVADGDFDGDALPDRAALVAAGSGYALQVIRGAVPGTPVRVAEFAEPAGASLDVAADGMLSVTVPGAAPRTVRWTGTAFVLG